MSDFKVEIKLSWDGMGVKDKADMYINYFEGECEGVDDRIIQFFRDNWRKAYSLYRQRIADVESELKAAEIEREDREEYERLKKKFGST